MSYELIVGRKTPGDLLNLTNSVTTASWITQRTGNPGKLTFTYLRTPQSKIEEKTLTYGVSQAITGGADGEQRNSYFNVPSSTLVVLDLRNKKIVAYK